MLTGRYHYWGIMRNFFLFLFVKEPETEVGLTEIRDHVSTGILSETVELKP